MTIEPVPMQSGNREGSMQCSDILVNKVNPGGRHAILPAGATAKALLVKTRKNVCRSNYFIENEYSIVKRIGMQLFAPAGACKRAGRLPICCHSVSLSMKFPESRKKEQKAHENIERERDFERQIFLFMGCILLAAANIGVFGPSKQEMAPNFFCVVDIACLLKLTKSKFGE